MARLPARFPLEISDEVLRETLSAMLERVHAWSEDFDRILPELQLALIEAAVAEQARRENARAQRRSQMLAYAALALSVIGLVASLVFALAR